MAKRKQKRTWAKWLGLGSLGLVAGGIYAVMSGLAPVNPGAPSHYLRISRVTNLSRLLVQLEEQGVLRNHSATRLVALLTRHQEKVGVGTYLVGPGMSGSGILRSLNKAIHQNVRIPENFWAARVGGLLERKDVCSADEYDAAVQTPRDFRQVVSFSLPKDSLEGYLYPDTYDLPPLLGASDVIERQLRDFEKKVWEPAGKPKDIQKILTIASLIELEVNRDEERPLVSAVIANRLAKHMRLQIDASLNYGLGVWRPLAVREYRTVPGPYNLYTHDGLPPGPICSPTYKSVEAAMHPANVPYLYYVALPDGHTLFAATPEEHAKNIAKRKAAIKARAAAKQ
jgi:UPF0755 protein